MLQWIAKPSCGSELVFLDLYPESLQPNEAEARNFLCCLTPAEGGVLKSGGAVRSVSAVWSVSAVLAEGWDVSRQPHPEIRPLADKIIVASIEHKDCLQSGTLATFYRSYC